MRKLLVGLVLLVGCGGGEDTSSPSACGESAGGGCSESAADACSEAEAITWELSTEAQSTKARFLKKDAGLRKFFDKSHSFAIFPSIGKGGLIIGGAHGKGEVYEAGKLVGTASMTQVTIGAQIGGQTFAEVIFFETAAALKRFKGSEYEFSAQISAVVAKEGASSGADYRGGVAVFTMANKGLMAEASIGGQKFKFKHK